MTGWLFPAGTALLLIVAYDLASTTLVTTTAAGPLTSRIGGALWSLARRLARRPDSVLMQLIGPIIVVVTIMVWLLLLWGGWTLIFSADPDAVLSSTTQVPADGWSRVYFAAFTVFTLGVGDYVPNGAPWQVLTSVGVISGLALTTMAITYLVPVVTAVTSRRTQANTIAGLGGTPVDIVLNSWRDGSFHFLDQQLPQLAHQVLLTAERHLAYPVLHFFHSAAPEEDFRVQLFALDEAVTILEAAVPASAGPHPAALASVRHATTQLLNHLGLGDTPGEAPAPLDLDPLRDAGVPTLPDEQVLERLATVSNHRRRLAVFAEESLWHRPPTVTAAEGGRS